MDQGSASRQGFLYTLFLSTENSPFKELTATAPPGHARVDAGRRAGQARASRCPTDLSCGELGDDMASPIAGSGGHGLILYCSLRAWAVAGWVGPASAG